MFQKNCHDVVSCDDFVDGRGLIYDVALAHDAHYLWEGQEVGVVIGMLVVHAVST